MSNTSKPKEEMPEKEILAGIERGDFKEAGTVIRNKKGEIVKIINRGSSNLLPTTFIQNNTVIYQADFSTIFETIKNIQKDNKFEDLEVKYNTICDFLTAYKSYGNNLDDLFRECLKTSNSFDSTIQKYLPNINLNDESDILRLKGSLKAYIMILFIYIVSTFLQHGQKFKDDTLIIGKILSLENHVRNFYETLVYANNNTFDFSGSLYEFFPTKKLDISLLTKIASHDRKIEGFTCFMKKFIDLFSEKDITNNGVYNKKAMCLDIKYFYHETENKINIVLFLGEILDDIENLKNFRNEIIDIESNDEALAALENNLSQKLPAI